MTCSPWRDFGPPPSGWVVWGYMAKPPKILLPNRRGGWWTRTSSHTCSCPTHITPALLQNVCTPLGIAPSFCGPKLARHSPLHRKFLRHVRATASAIPVLCHLQRSLTTPEIERGGGSGRDRKRERSADRNEHARERYTHPTTIPSTCKHTYTAQTNSESGQNASFHLPKKVRLSQFFSRPSQCFFV